MSKRPRRAAVLTPVLMGLVALIALPAIADPDITITPTSITFDYTTSKAVTGPVRIDPKHDALTTSTATPPPGMDPGLRRDGKLNGTLLADVPAYDWTNGCGPTAVGMVVGYWDIRGFGDLVPGDASTQTTAVSAMISSSGNWNDYCLPLDDGSNILPDMSEPPFGDEHDNDCVADFMNTSRSYNNNAYGWSWFSDTANGWMFYVQSVDPALDPDYEEHVWGDLSWGDFKAEIDAGRPVGLIVDTDADGSTDHFVTAIGYDDDNTTYACLNTWDYQIHWYAFAAMSPGRPFGIHGASFFRLDGAQSFIVRNDGVDPLEVTSLSVEGGSAWITSILPAAPLTVAAGETQSFVVRVDPDLAVGTQTDRILVHSDDPDESPYPDAVHVTLEKDPAPATPGAPWFAMDPVCEGDDMLVLWTAVPDADHYYVYHDGEQIGDALTMTFAPVSALAGDWTVAAGNVNGLSEQGPATPLDVGVAPDAPGAPDVTPNPYPTGTETMDVAWTLVDGADWYEVFVDDVSAGTIAAPPMTIPCEEGMVTVCAGNDCGASDPGPATEVTAGSTGVDDVPGAFRLHACTPNPFNPSTTIAYDLPEASPVHLAVFDLQGRRVRLLADGPRPAGANSARWDGRTDDGQAAAAGAYVCRLIAGGREASVRMLLVK